MDLFSFFYMQPFSLMWPVVEDAVFSPVYIFDFFIKTQKSTDLCPCLQFHFTGQYVCFYASTILFILL